MQMRCKVVLFYLYFIMQAACSIRQNLDSGESNTAYTCSIEDVDDVVVIAYMNIIYWTYIKWHIWGLYLWNAIILH